LSRSTHRERERERERERGREEEDGLRNLMDDRRWLAGLCLSAFRSGPLGWTVAGSRKAEVRATMVAGREKQNRVEATINPKP